MDRTAIEALLAEPHLIVLAIDRGGKEPFVAPVWFEYHDGRILIWTNAPTAKTRLARRNPAVTLSLQTETRPYKAVLIRGRAELRTPRDRDLVRRLAHRYLGEQEGDAYTAGALAGAPDEAQGTLVITPTAWRAWDYGESGDADATPWTPDAELR